MTNQVVRKCSVPDCTKPYLANGYCAKHNARFKKYGDPCAPIKNRWDEHVKTQKKCSNPTCDQLVWKGKYCNKCRQRKHRHGDVNVVKPTGNKEIWKLAKNGGPKPKYAFDSSILNEWSPALAWLLGWTITDGCVEQKTRSVVSWMLKDKEPLEIIQGLFKTDKPIEVVPKTNKKTGKKKLYYRLRLCGKKVVKKFIELGVEPNKTFITRLPKIPKELMWHFLRGVMEGDGCIHLAKNIKGYKKDYVRLRMVIASGNSVFLEQIEKVVGYGTIHFNKRSGHQVYSLVLDCHQAFYFLTNAYQNSEGLRLARKYEKWQTFLKSGQTYKERLT